MNYIQNNKAAWEEAYDNRRNGWGDDNHNRLVNERLPFINQDVKKIVERMDFADKEIAQFCCNNGREILSLMQLGAARGIGFDIAENLIGQARDTAQKAGIGCEFVCCNILEIGSECHERFDFIIFTIGAITWFKDLRELFGVVSRCLKKGGKLLIHDYHSFMNMLALPGEQKFSADKLDRLAYPYFKDHPWIETDGANYMTEKQNTNEFISFAHTTSSIMNSVIQSGMMISSYDEFDYDVGLTEAYDNMKYPLSYILLAEKQ